MIQLTKDFVMIADGECYAVGKARNSIATASKLIKPKYYTTAAQAVRGTIQLAMMQSVKNEEVTTLRQFVEELERLKAEIAQILEPLEV